MSAWRRAVQAAGELLREGKTVTPRMLAEMAKLTVPEDDAYRNWLVNFTRAAAHEAGKALGITVWAVGNGQGYREPQSPEELAEAQRRSEKQIIAQAGRRKEIRAKIRDQNQNYLPLEEAPPDADIAHSAQQSRVASG